MKRSSRNILLATGLLTGTITGCAHDTPLEAIGNSCTAIYPSGGEEHHTLPVGAVVTVEFVEPSVSHDKQFSETSGTVIDYTGRQVIRMAQLPVGVSDQKREGFDEAVTLVVSDHNEDSIGLTRGCIFREKYQFGTYYTYAYIPEAM